MKKRVVTILAMSIILLGAIFLTQDSYAWQTQQLNKGENNLTVQSTYLNNESTIAINLKSENKFGESSNVLTKKDIKDIIKQKYGKDLVKYVYNKNGIVIASDEKYVGTGCKVELITNEVLTVILFGDVNCDGQIDTDDTVAIAKHNVHTLDFNKYQEKAAHLTVKKNANDPEIDTDDTVRIAFYNVNGLGKGNAGDTIVDSTLYPADEKLNTGLELKDLSEADDTYKTALSTLTNNKFTENNEEVKLQNGKIEGTIKYNFDVGTELFPKDELTGYYFAYVIKVKGANENTTITIKNSDKNPKEIAYTNFDVTEDGKEGIVMLSSLDEEATNKKIVIEVDLDGDGTLYKPYTETIDYSDLTFDEVISAKITTDIPEKDRSELKGDKWNYRFEFSDAENKDEGYSIEETDRNYYKVKGVITKQSQVNGFGEDDKDYYIVFAIEPSVITEGISIGIPRKDSYETVSNDALVDGKLTAIIALDPEKQDEKTFKIKIDLDGNGEKYQEEEITFDYSELKFEETSMFSVKKQLPQKEGTDDTTVKSKLDTYHFNPSEYFDKIGGDSLEIKKDENRDQYYTVSGLVPKMTEVRAGFEDEENGGYYILYTIETNTSGKEGNDSINDKVKVTFTSPSTGEDIDVRKVDHTAFDTATEMAVLWKLDENRTDKTVKITVDLDEDESKYAPYHIILDYSGVRYQKETTANINVIGNKDNSDVSDEDKAELESWGYTFPDDIKLENAQNVEKNKPLSYVDGKLTGLVKEQVLTGGYTGEDLDSYFFNFTIKPSNITENIEVKVKDGKKEEVTFKYTDFKPSEGNDNEKVLNVLKRISKDFEKCSDAECCDESGNCKDIEKCKNVIKISIDADGSSNYDFTNSEVYYIDYCDVDFINLHKVSFKQEELGEEKKQDEKDLISPIYVYDGEKLQKPENPTIRHDVDDNQYNDLSYWREAKKSEEVDGQAYKTEYKFDNDGKSEKEIKADLTLYPIWEINVDTYIENAIGHINQKPNVKDKLFVIEKNENNIKVEIEDKSTQIDNITDTAIASTIAHAFASHEIKEIDVKLNQDEQEEAIETLSLKSSELVVENQTEENIKTNVISKLKDFFKSENVSNSEHTLESLCTTCDGKELEVTIKPNESLAKFKGKDYQESVTYKVTFEKEVEISFDAGVLESPQTKYVKLGSNVDSLPTPTMSEAEKKYRTFVGWFDTEEKKVDKIENAQEDKKLTAHYTLNIDKFIDEVINDLNVKEVTDYSDNFDGKFNLSRKNNDITINIENPKVQLTELANTSIPGTIAYLLEKEEISDITLAIGNITEEEASSKSLNFTKLYTAEAGAPEYNESADRDEQLLQDGGALKKEIIKGTKKLFNDELDSKESTVTLDQLEYEGKTITIKVGSAIDTVKLVDEQNKENLEDEDLTYTFSLDSNFAVLNTAGEFGAKNINDILNKDYEKIYLESDITLDDTLTIEQDKPVTIESLVDKKRESTIHSISVSNKDYVIDVKSKESEINNIADTNNTITIENLKLKGGSKAALKVEKGTTVKVNNLDLSEISADTELPERVKKEKVERIESEPQDKKEFIAGIIVEGKLEVEDNSTLVNTKETYVYPTIRIPNSSNGIVEGASNMTSISNYKNISRVYANFDTQDDTYDKCYYLDGNHSKTYFIMFIDPLNKKSGEAFSMYKIYFEGEKIDTEEIRAFRTECEHQSSNINDYEYKGWYRDSVSLGSVGKNGPIYDFDNEPLRDSVTYYAAYTLKNQ